jgi:PKD repeat protein
MGTVKAAVPIPYNSWGHPYDETDVKMLDGELITSFIDGVDYGNNMTFNAALDVWYDIQTRGNWVMAPGSPNSEWEKEGGDLDEPIMYVWGDMTNTYTDPDGDSILNYGVFEEYAPWITNQSIPMDIYLSPTQPSIFPKISIIVPEPTDGYGDYVLIFAEDPDFDMSQFYLEKNDGVLSGPSQSLVGITNATGYYYANLTDISLDACGDELKLVWINTGTAFNGMDVVVDRVEWNATTGGTHNVGLDHEPDNTDMTDAAAPACGQVDFAIRRQGVFPTFDQDTNDNAIDFVVDIPWPRPVIGPPVSTWNLPIGGEIWTGGADHQIWWETTDARFGNAMLDIWVNYSLLDGVAGSWNEATLVGIPGPHPFTGWANPMQPTWTLPVADTDIARLQVCAENPDKQSACTDSERFTIDSTPPDVLNTNPVDSDTDVPFDFPIHINFTESMDKPSVESAIEIFPVVTGIAYDWPADSMYVRVLHDDFEPNTTYCVNVTTAAKDISDPGNFMVAMHQFCFTTYAPEKPVVDLTYPDGGEIWSGGVSHRIWWNMSDTEDTDNTLLRVWVNYSLDSGGSWTAIAGAQNIVGMANPNAYDWNVPNTINSNQARINVTVQDTDGMSSFDVSLADFTIDSTPPDVIESDPMDTEIDVPVDKVIRIEFSELVIQALVDVWVRTSGGDTVNGTLAWLGDNVNITFTPDNPLGASEYYTVLVNRTGVIDLSDPGNIMAADYFFSFTTESTPFPTVQVTNPGTGDRLKGEELETITWTMSDVNTPTAELEVDVFFYEMGGLNTSIVFDLIGNTSYEWTVVCPRGMGDDYDVRISVDVTDAEGQTTTNNSGTFTVDCTRPTASIDSVDSAKEDTSVDFAVTGASETLSAYSWTFGDLGTSTSAAPSHTYADPDTYTVTLIVTDSVGWDSLAITKSITITKVDEFDLGIWLWIIIIIIIAVVVAIIAAILAKRRKKPEEEAPPVAPEEEVEAPEEEVVEEEPVVEEEAPAVEEPVEEPAVEEAAPAAAAAPAEEKPAGETKECPSCGTVVPGDATECFLCGATL